ncbi:ATP-binding cassette domain-containing protein [Desulfovibrio sp. OttesenSCG-928-M14]|nr:ATP-binding cassette domain-containing protein [Desulfovibrio sp. OttesenSCG-928-M14]
MLELKNIRVTITGDNGQPKNILDDVSLKVEADSFFVITGPNGGGKSTLAKVIMGIRKADEGAILFEGRDITELGVSERARLGIGFAFQQPVRFKGICVQDVLSLAAGRKLSVEEACCYLSEVGMCANDYINRELNATLSGGEMKRIEIAMLIARGTVLSVFDEPEAGIDLWSFQNLIAVFRKLRESRKGAAIIISHQERILEVADTIAVLNQGKLSMVGDKEMVLPTLSRGTSACDLFRSVAQ